MVLPAVARIKVIIADGPNLIGLAIGILYSMGMADGNVEACVDFAFRRFDFAGNGFPPFKVVQPLP